MTSMFIGASVSEPHTSEFNCDFSYILSGVRRSVNQVDILLTRNSARRVNVRTEYRKEHVVKQLAVLHLSSTSEFYFRVQLENFFFLFCYLYWTWTHRALLEKLSSHRRSKKTGDDAGTNVRGLDVRQRQRSKRAKGMYYMLREIPWPPALLKLNWMSAL